MNDGAINGTMVCAAAAAATISPSSLAGLPEQFLLIRDPLLAGGADLISSDSEYGPRVGMTTPYGSSNFGSLLPTVLSETQPGNATAVDTYFGIPRGGGVGSAEFSYLPGLDEEWRGAWADIYAWGHQVPAATAADSPIVIYSRVFRRVIVAWTTATTVVVARLDGDERPNAATHSQWATTTLTPTAGVNDTKHALAGCELRDGTILLAIRQAVLDAAVVTTGGQGDWDLWRSTDGGVTFRLAVENVFQTFGDPGLGVNRVTLRIASSGSYVRIVVPSDSAPTIATLISSDGGVTWTRAADITTNPPAYKTDQDQDKVSFDLVGLDDATGTFLIAGGSTSPSQVRFWSATREEDWTASNLVGAISGFATPRSYAFIRDPYWLWLYVHFNDPGNPDRQWQVYRVPRTSALVGAQWEIVDNPFRLQSAARLVPMQLRGAWAGDRGVMVATLQDLGVASPYSRYSDRFVLWWIGGWSVRPSATDYHVVADDILESPSWNYTLGEPFGGATSATQSDWTQTLTAGGTHQMTDYGVRYQTFANGDVSRHKILFDTGDADCPPTWDPTAATERLWQKLRRFALEFVATPGQTSSFSSGAIGVRLDMPSIQSPGAGWQIGVRLGTNSAVVYDIAGSAPLVTLTGISPNAGDEGRAARWRLCVAPAATPSAPIGILQHRMDDGDYWHESSTFNLPQPSGAGITQVALFMGNLDHSNGATTVTSWFREARVFGFGYRTDYTSAWTAVDLPGALTSGRSRSLGSGSTATDSALLAAAWGGGGGARADVYVHSLEHDGAAELSVGVDSPRIKWYSVAGATAGTYLVLDACRGGTDNGRRFVHSHASLFGLESRRVGIEYADDSTFTTALVAAGTVDSISFENLRVDTVAGRVLALSAGTTQGLRRSELGGKFLLVTAGVGQGRIHKISRHLWDGSVHQVVLGDEGQFDGTTVPAGATVAVLAARGWLSYGQVYRKRYMRLRFGASGDNSWDGRWALGQLVAGIARKFDPPLDWSHSDEEEPNVTEHRTKSGQTWAREEGPAARVWAGRIVGDGPDQQLRYELRDLLRTVAKYSEQPIALLINGEVTADQDRTLLLARYDGASIVDNQAWFRSTDNVARRVGDMQVQFKEIV